jgi:hypothetical protein
MASKTGIANRALSKLGEKRVSNIDTVDKKSANVIRFMWDSVRDAMLQAYPWNFSVKRKQIGADGSTPAWGWSKQYSLPSDFLSLLSIKDKPDYTIEGGYIMTNSTSPIYIKYISRITNTGQFDALFTEAFAAQLAVEACEELTQSNTKKQILIQERDRIIEKAYASDAIQNPSVDLETDEWLLERESSYVYDEIDYNA